MKIDLQQYDEHELTRRVKLSPALLAMRYQMNFVDKLWEVFKFTPRQFSNLCYEIYKDSE
jgi:hypothetical protein